MVKDKRVLLIGGAGFLGIGLLEELVRRNVAAKSLDKEDIDLEQERDVVAEALQQELSDCSDVVMLASRLGAKLFESDHAEEAANANKKMFDNVLYAVKETARMQKQSFLMTYYSSSELFGSLKSADNLITDMTPYSFDSNRKRYLYSYFKWQAEKELLALNELHPEVLSNVKIVKPFNIYGKNLKRGVVFDMVSSALHDNKIWYAANTTRTMTSIDIASKTVADAILSDKNVKVNVADPRCSLTMKSLAKIVNNVLGLNCQLIEKQPDSYIQFRTISKVDTNIDVAREIMRPHIVALAEEIKKSI